MVVKVLFYLYISIYIVRVNQPEVTRTVRALVIFHRFKTEACIKVRAEETLPFLLEFILCLAWRFLDGDDSAFLFWRLWKKVCPKPMRLLSCLWKELIFLFFKSEDLLWDTIVRRTARGCKLSISNGNNIWGFVNSAWKRGLLLKLLLKICFRLGHLKCKSRLECYTEENILAMNGWQCCSGVL